MSGETGQDVSGWTIDTLGAHMDRRLTDLAGLLEERYRTQQKAMETAFIAAEKALDQRAGNLDREFHEHLAQVRHENQLALINADKAVAAALLSTKEAIHKSEIRYDARFLESNHIREQLAEQAGTFMPREVADGAIKELRDGIARLTTRLDTNQGKTAGYSQLYGWAIGGVGLLITILVFVNAMYRSS